MKRPNIYSLLLLFFLITIFQNSFSQQNENQLFITNSANRSKSILADTDYFIKIKTTNGEKIRGKFLIQKDGLFISTKGDTINFNEIKWIKARKQLRNGQKTIATIGLVSGVYFSFGTIPAAFMIPAIGGSYLIVLAPVATISAAVIGFRTLSGRKYKLKKWDLEVN